MNRLKKLRQENNAFDKKLSQENNGIIRDMVCYLRSSDLCDYDLEIMRRELTGMALEAQLRGDDFHRVIGRDYKTFCTELMANGRQKTTYAKVVEMAYILITGIGVLYLIEIVMSSALKRLLQFGEYRLPITAGFLLSTVLICCTALGVYHYVTKKSFELSQPGSKSKYVFGIGLAVAWVIIVLCKVFFKTAVMTINMFYPLAFFMIAHVVTKILSNRHDNSYFSL